MVLLLFCVFSYYFDRIYFKTPKTKIMKTIFYTFVVLAGLSSCKSVEKMVEKGEYDKAFNYTISKLEGEKNKETEYVRALEKAFVKLNSASLREIEKLNADAKPENWSRVLGLYTNIENRQEALDPLLPLESEDGYIATFDIKNYRNEILNAEENTCLYFYNNANNLLSKAEKSGQKILARDAYNELIKIEQYNVSYRESEKLKNKALELGLTRIHIEIFNDLRNFHGSDIERAVMNLPVNKLDDLWKDFSIGENKGLNPDYIAEIELFGLGFSPERETINNYTEHKEVILRVDHVKERRDSVDVWVEKQVYEKIRADITEVFREKKSELHGRLKIMDSRTKEFIKTIPVDTYYDFKGFSCHFSGDKRALTDFSKKRMDAFLEPFPSDFDMADDLSVAFKNTVLNEIKKVRFD